MSDPYKSRVHQLRAIEREVHNGKTSLRQALKDAAMIGACEERDRTLAILRHFCHGELVEKICSRSVLEVLGYPTKTKGPKR